MSTNTARNEALLSFFTARGYQPILAARSNLSPPDIYFLESDRYKRFGALDQALSSQAVLPTPSEGVVSELENIDTRSKDAQLSLVFFKSLIERFGLSGSPSITAKGALKGDEILRFQGVTVRTVDPLAIEKALNAGLEIDKLGSDRIATGVVHIAYEYLYSSRVEVVFGNRNSASIGLNAGFTDVAEAKADSSFAKDNVDVATHHGKKNPVAIAFKAAQLVRREKSWRLRMIITSAVGIDPRQAINTPYVFKPNSILTFDDENP